jgi:hypothetical protein
VQQRQSTAEAFQSQDQAQGQSQSQSLGQPLAPSLPHP